MKNSSIALTGGTGYLGAWILQGLITLGHPVKLLVRDSKKAKDQLANLIEKASAPVVFVEVDLLKPESLLNACSGCEALIHSAGPVAVDTGGDPFMNLIQPALAGTENILRSLENLQEIKQVVFTSSTTTIYGDTQDIHQTARGVFSEDDWNSSSGMDHFPYAAGKTMAEQMAWDMYHAQSSWDLKVLNPGFFMGPSCLRHTTSTTYNFVGRILEGEFAHGLPDFYNPVVDVRDVALAHLLALQCDISGRCILANQSISYFEISKRINELFPQRFPINETRIPKEVMTSFSNLFGYTSEFWEKNLGHKIIVDNTKSREDLGLDYRPLKETIKDHVLGFLEAKSDSFMMEKITNFGNQIADSASH